MTLQQGTHTAASPKTLRVTNVDTTDLFGGNGGHVFDSGVNPSSVAKVHLEFGSYNSKAVLKRFHLSFRDGRSTMDDICVGVLVHSLYNTKHTFTIDPSDRITRICLWSDESCVNAIQIHLSSGIVSPMYGIPKSNAKLSELEFDSTTIVGVTGRFGSIIDKLGFKFADVEPNVLNVGHLEVKGANVPDGSFEDDAEDLGSCWTEDN